MALDRKLLIVLLSIAAASAADKEKPKFAPGPIDSYPHLTIQKVTVAASPFASESQTEPAFGKLNPNRYGVLPVLVLIKNDTGKAVALSRIKFELILPGRDRIEATPAAEVKYLTPAERPQVYAPPVPQLPVHVKKNKNPLNAWEIEGRAFTARMLPPGESASGFVYFRTDYHSGSQLYLTGVRDAASGQELFYFEIPLDKDR